MNKDGDGVVCQVRWWLDGTAPSSICISGGRGEAGAAQERIGTWWPAGAFPRSPNFENSSQPIEGFLAMSKYITLFLVMLLVKGGTMGQSRESGNRRDGVRKDRSIAVSGDRGSRTPAPPPQTPHRPPPGPVRPVQVISVTPTCIVDNNITVVVNNEPSVPNEPVEVFLLDYRQKPEVSGYDFSEDEIVHFDDPMADMFYEYSDGYYYMNVIDGGDIVDLGNEQISGTSLPGETWKHRKDIRLEARHSYAIRTPDGDVYSIKVVRLSPRFVVFRDVVRESEPEEDYLSESVSDAGREEAGGSRFGR